MPRLALVVALLVTLGAQGRARAGDEAADPLAGLSGKAALEIATELSADKMKGRRTGFEGGKRADDFIAQAMAEMGLHPKDPAGAYLDAFEFAAGQVKAPIALSIGATALVYGKDFVELPDSGSGKVEGELVPRHLGKEYAQENLKGKVVLVVGSAGEGDLGATIGSVAEGGAKALLVCVGELAVPLPPVRGVRGRIPALRVAASAWRRIMEDPANFKVFLEVNVELKPRAQGHNALGAIAGTDPDLRNEVVVVGANMDALGVDAEGRTLPGADDNASGTAVLLHVAKTLIDNGWRPKRMVLFVAFGGGEADRAGARHLADGLPFEHDGVVCAIAVSRVGQGDPSVALFGAEPRTAMATRLMGYVPTLAKRMSTPAGADPGGDHAPFAAKGVPAFLLSTQGEHPNLGTTGDVAANLKPESLEIAAQVLGRLIVGLGDEPTSLKAK